MHLSNIYYCLIVFKGKRSTKVFNLVKVLNVNNKLTGLNRFRNKFISELIAKKSSLQQLVFLNLKLSLNSSFQQH